MEYLGGLHYHTQRELSLFEINDANKKALFIEVREHKLEWHLEMGTLRKKPHNEKMEEKILPTLCSQRVAIGLIAILATNISGKKNFGSFSRS